MIEAHERLASTQAAAHDRAEAGAPHGTAVMARVQTAGRGTRGRSWASEPGGLWLSVITRPATPAEPALASLRTGLALARRIAPLVSEPVRLKWPNDLIVADRKLAGILCEARWTGDRMAWMVTGVGLNVRNTVPEALADTAIRLADLGCPATPEDLAPVVVEAVLEAAALDGPLTPGELAEFAARDWLRGRELAAPVGGRAAGITPDGRLRIDCPDGGVVDTVGPVGLAGLAPGEASR